MLYTTQLIKQIYRFNLYKSFNKISKFNNLKAGSEHLNNRTFSALAKVEANDLNSIDVEKEKNFEGLEIKDLELSPLIQKNLKARGINQLFDIQKDCFPHILNGFDLVGRARTGTGKTLAFALPIIEKLERSNQRSKLPRVLILAPTRELASQVEKEISLVSGKAYSTICIYGGSSYTVQENRLNKGVDIVVGTPGRIQDLINKGSLKLNKIDTVVLDEADHMLDIGFSKELDAILDCVREQRKLFLNKLSNDSTSSVQPFQFLLFSATIPSWIKKVIKNYLNKDYVTIDHVGNDSLKASKDVKQLAIPTLPLQIPYTIAGLLKTHISKEGRCVVFCQTKSYCDSLANNLNKIGGVNAVALHGDVSQSSREIALADFKKGKISCLVATDVAARGLDISNVEMVIQAEPPSNPETFIHRSGRTGRAGKTGTNVVLFHPIKDKELIEKIESNAGVQFNIIRAPTLNDLNSAYIKEFINGLKKVQPSSSEVIQLIKTNINELPSYITKDHESALAACFQATLKMNPMISGSSSRSLIDAKEDIITLIAKGTNRIKDIHELIYNEYQIDSKNVPILKWFPVLKESSIVFDIPYNSYENFLKEFEKKNENDNNLISIEICEELPLLIKKRDRMEFKNNNFKESNFRKDNNNRGRKFGDNYSSFNRDRQRERNSKFNSNNNKNRRNRF